LLWAPRGHGIAAVRGTVAASRGVYEQHSTALNTPNGKKLVPRAVPCAAAAVPGTITTINGVYMQHSAASCTATQGAAQSIPEGVHPLLEQHAASGSERQGLRDQACSVTALYTKPHLSLSTHTNGLSNHPWGWVTAHTQASRHRPPPVNTAPRHHNTIATVSAIPARY
jgi:hypothetical protein